MLELDKLQGKLLTYLTEEEKTKALRYKFDADRIRSAVGACLIKAGIRRAYPGEDISVCTTELGKPYVKDHSGYEFNLSHSGRMIVFVEDGDPVGIDVELVKEKDWRLFHRYLTKDEMSMIERSEDPEACFFEIWTVREAFAKEEGQGLMIFDKNFNVNYERHIITYDGRKLFFKSFDHEADEKYKISICSPHEISELEVTEMTKTDWEKQLSVIRKL